MRSAVKIILAIITIAALFLGLSLLINIIVLYIPGTSLRNSIASIYEERGEDPRYWVYAVLFAVLAIMSLLNALVSYFTIKRLNSAYKKRELALPIVLLFLTWDFLPALLILFTPSSKIVSKHPYFE